MAIIPLFGMMNPDNNGTDIVTILIGAIFWLGIILGYVLLFIANSIRKKRVKKRARKRRPGIAVFFSSRTAMIADFVMAVCFIVFLINILFIKSNANWVYVLISTMIFSLHMHALLNGENFRYISAKNKIKSENRKEEE